MNGILLGTHAITKWISPGLGQATPDRGELSGFSIREQGATKADPPGACLGSESIFAVEHLSLAYPGRRGQPPAQILTDISVDNRLEEPPAGVVRFDGRPITELDLRELRRRAALVLQTPVLFEGSVRDNLRVLRASRWTSRRVACARCWARWAWSP